MTARYHGKAGKIYMSTTGSGTAVPVGSLSAFTLDTEQETVETTAFGDTNKQYVAGLRDLKGTFEGFWDTDDAVLFTGSQSADGVKLYLYPSGNAPTKVASGPAWVSASLSTGVGDAVKVRGSFTANGAWTISL